MPIPATLRPALRRLAGRPSAVTLRRLWRALNPEERERAIRLALDGGADRHFRAMLIQEVAALRR